MKKSFYLFLEEALNLTAPEIYHKLGWTVQRYHKAKSCLYPFSKNFEHVRISLGLSVDKFYSLVKAYFTGVPKKK